MSSVGTPGVGLRHRMKALIPIGAHQHQVPQGNTSNQKHKQWNNNSSIKAKLKKLGKKRLISIDNKEILQLEFLTSLRFKLTTEKQKY